MNDLHTFFERQWIGHENNHPTVQKIVSLLEQRGESLVNDHIAYRTFAGEKTGLEVMTRFFCKMGLRPGGEYLFKEKKLKAIHLEHPNDENCPKVFISELLIAEFSDEFQKIIQKLVESIPENQKVEELLEGQRPWSMTYSLYEKLLQESEYAAWLAAMGFRPNHFTVSLNHLKTFQNIMEFNQFLKDHGVVLNSSGGEVKGTSEVFLEQSSTMADVLPVQFDDGVHEIPTCYFEFAKRYKKPDGKLFQGFVTQSADKIFESTNS